MIGRICPQKFLCLVFTTHVKVSLCVSGRLAGSVWPPVFTHKQCNLQPDQPVWVWSPVSHSPSDTLPPQTQASVGTKRSFPSLFLVLSPFSRLNAYQLQNVCYIGAQVDCLILQHLLEKPCFSLLLLLKFYGQLGNISSEVAHF